METFSLSVVANVAEIVGAGSILTGVIFGLYQLHHYREQQRNTVAMNLMQTFYDQGLADALSLLNTVPDGITLKKLREMGPDYHRAAFTVTTSFETMGLLVYRRMASLDLVLDLAGGIVVTMNRKLKRWQEDVRQEQSQPSWGEWFEWLGDQAEKRKSQKEPAHIRFRDWQP